MKYHRFFCQWIIILSLILNVNTMNAQSRTDTLNKEQQSIVAISALTAIGDLENLKIQLNGGLDAGLSRG